MASNVFNFLPEISALTLSIMTTSYKYSDISNEWKELLKNLIGITKPFTGECCLNLNLTTSIIKDSLWCLFGEKENLRRHGIEAVHIDESPLGMMMSSPIYDISIKEGLQKHSTNPQDAGITFNIR